MKHYFKLLFIFILSNLLAKDIKQPEMPDSLSLCDIRGHTVEYYTVAKDNDHIWIEDYPDSTVVYYYPKSKETGKIMRCKRCGEWLSPPVMDNPAHEVIWKKNADKNMKKSIEDARSEK